MKMFRVYYRERKHYTEYQIHSYPCNCQTTQTTFSFRAPESATSAQAIAQAIKSSHTADVSIQPCAEDDNLPIRVNGGDLR